MASAYIGLKWLHIATMAIAFGSNVTHFFWILSANKDALHRANILRLVKKIDDRLAVPCYAITVSCGVAMWLLQWPLATSWIIASVLLTVLLGAAGSCYGPFMHRWIRHAANLPADERQLARLQRYLTIYWGMLILMVPLILHWMVAKPLLW